MGKTLSYDPYGQWQVTVNGGQQQRPPEKGNQEAVIILLVLALIGAGVWAYMNGKFSLGSEDNKGTNPASVSISGARPCQVSGGNVHLTKERLPTCVQAKKYAKAIIVDTYKSDADKQFKCLDTLWTNESQWSAWAKNPSSAAFGIAQIHPGVHKTNFGLGDWKEQVDWGLEYINGRYKTPCAAWTFWLSPTVNVPGASKHWY